MADVIPPANLPPEAQPWGRQITKLAVDLETNTSRNLNDINNNQKALNDNVNNLADNVAYLRNLSVNVEQNSSEASTSSNGTYALIKNVAVTFTLTQRAQVLYTATGDVFASVTDGTSSFSAYAWSYVKLVRGGSSYNGAPHGVNIVNTTSNGIAWEMNVGVVGIETLNPGTYTVTAEWYGQIGDATATGSVLARTCQLIAQVIG